MLKNPWDVRPRPTKGGYIDITPHTIYYAIGRALSTWEALESMTAELFDSIVSKDNNRIGHVLYSNIKSASARNAIFTSIVPRAEIEVELKQEVLDLISYIGHFGARRNEIAHGMVGNLGDFGHQLSPNNTMPHKWNKAGVAKFQYTSKDIVYYAEEFDKLLSSAQRLSRIISGRHSNIYFTNNLTSQTPDYQRKFVESVLQDI